MEINKIYHIDCFDGFRQIEDKSISHVFTSPPYNRKRNDKYEHHNDVIDDYFGWLCNVVDECIRVSKGFVFFNIMKSYYNKEDVFKLIGKYSDKIQEIIIWEKTNPLPSAGNAITNAYEFFIVFGDSALKSNSTYVKNIISTAVNSDMTSSHKAIMKEDVADWFIKNFTKEGEDILDPFMGAGTTLLTGLRANRRVIGIEGSDKYFDMASKGLDIALSAPTLL